MDHLRYDGGRTEVEMRTLGEQRGLTLMVLTSSDRPARKTDLKFVIAHVHL